MQNLHSASLASYIDQLSKWNIKLSILNNPYNQKYLDDCFELTSSKEKAISNKKIFEKTLEIMKAIPINATGRELRTVCATLCTSMNYFAFSLKQDLEITKTVDKLNDVFSIIAKEEDPAQLNIKLIAQSITSKPRTIELRSVLAIQGEDATQEQIDYLFTFLNMAFLERRAFTLYSKLTIRWELLCQCRKLLKSMGAEFKPKDSFSDRIDISDCFYQKELESDDETYCLSVEAVKLMQSIEDRKARFCDVRVENLLQKLFKHVHIGGIGKNLFRIYLAAFRYLEAYTLYHDLHQSDEYRDIKTSTAKVLGPETTKNYLSVKSYFSLLASLYKALETEGNASILHDMIRQSIDRETRTGKERNMVEDRSEGKAVSKDCTSVRLRCIENELYRKSKLYKKIQECTLEYNTCSNQKNSDFTSVYNKILEAFPKKIRKKLYEIQKQFVISARTELPNPKEFLGMQQECKLTPHILRFDEQEAKIVQDLKGNSHFELDCMLRTLSEVASSDYKGSEHDSENPIKSVFSSLKRNSKIWSNRPLSVRKDRMNKPLILSKLSQAPAEGFPFDGSAVTGFHIESKVFVQLQTDLNPEKIMDMGLERQFSLESSSGKFSPQKNQLHQYLEKEDVAHVPLGADVQKVEAENQVFVETDVQESIKKCEQPVFLTNRKEGIKQNLGKTEGLGVIDKANKVMAKTIPFIRGESGSQRLRYSAHVSRWYNSSTNPFKEDPKYSHRSFTREEKNEMRFIHNVGWVNLDKEVFKRRHGYIYTDQRTKTSYEAYSFDAKIIFDDKSTITGVYSYGFSMHSRVLCHKLFEQKDRSTIWNEFASKGCIEGNFEEAKGVAEDLLETTEEIESIGIEDFKNSADRIDVYDAKNKVRVIAYFREI
jgi:hypothetical protein